MSEDYVRNMPRRRRRRQAALSLGPPEPPRPGSLVLQGRGLSELVIRAPKGDVVLSVREGYRLMRDLALMLAIASAHSEFCETCAAADREAKP